MRDVEIVYRYGGGGAEPRRRPGDPGEARQRLDEGSRAFAEMLANVGGEGAPVRRVVDVDPRDLGLGSEGAAPAQRPYAAVLGCADARVPVELVFNEGPNDLFVVRVAGNALGGDALGSLKYAVDHLGESLKLVVVLGHSGCGAVTAAVDAYLDPASYLAVATSHALRGILDRLAAVINAAARKLADAYGPDVLRRAGYRTALIEAASVSHAALSAHTLQQHLAADAPAGLRAAYGVYLIDAHSIWAPRAGSTACAGLAYPPSDAAGFAAFAGAVVRSERIASLLGPAA